MGYGTCPVKLPPVSSRRNTPQKQSAVTLTLLLGLDRRSFPETQTGFDLHEPQYSAAGSSPTHPSTRVPSYLEPRVETLAGACVRGRPASPNRQTLRPSPQHINHTGSHPQAANKCSRVGGAHA
jgi:hypothetical protein